MIVIKFSCINQRLRRISSGIIPSNAYGKLKFEFDFRTDDWATVTTKVANFSYRGENYPIILDENNQCFVPKEVIYSPSFSVSVHGGDIVTNYVRNPVEGANPNMYEEIIKLIKEHTHEEYIEDSEIEEVLPNTFDAGEIIERS